MSILELTATFGQSASGERFLISRRSWARPRSAPSSSCGAASRQRAACASHRGDRV